MLHCGNCGEDSGWRCRPCSGSVLLMLASLMTGQPMLGCSDFLPPSRPLIISHTQGQSSSCCWLCAQKEKHLQKGSQHFCESQREVPPARSQESWVYLALLYGFGQAILSEPQFPWLSSV